MVHQRKDFLKRWNDQIKKGNPLERLRAKQMIELTKLGEMRELIPELVQTVLECIVIQGNGVYDVRFKDGTEQTIIY